MNHRPQKNQHWVPKFYLRYFATQDSRDSGQPKVWIFSNRHDDGEEKLTSVKNVCSKRFLYSPFKINGERDFGFEEKLSELESTLGPIWPSLAIGFVNLADETLRKGLALFAAVMYLRTPSMRDQIERLHKQLVDLLEAGPMLSDGTPAIESLEINGSPAPRCTTCVTSGIVQSL